MPNLKSAKKRVRTNEKRRLRNRAAKSTLKSGLKRVEALQGGDDPEALQRIAQQTLSLIGKTKRKGAVSRRRAARLQSRVQRAMNEAAAPSAPAPSE